MSVRGDDYKAKPQRKGSRCGNTTQFSQKSVLIHGSWLRHLRLPRGKLRGQAWHLWRLGQAHPQVHTPSTLHLPTHTPIHPFNDTHVAHGTSQATERMLPPVNPPARPDSLAHWLTNLSVSYPPHKARTDWPADVPPSARPTASFVLAL